MEILYYSEMSLSENVSANQLRLSDILASSVLLKNLNCKCSSHL